MPFIQCNGLESNEKFLEVKIVRKNIFVKKKSLKFFFQMKHSVVAVLVRILSQVLTGFNTG